MENKELSDMRNEKTEMFNKLKGKRNSKEYEQWFLKYQPEKKNTKKQKNAKKTKKENKKDNKLKPY